MNCENCGNELSWVKYIVESGSVACPFCENDVRKIMEKNHELDFLIEKLKYGWPIGSTTETVIEDLRQSLLTTINYVKKKI